LIARDQSFQSLGVRTLAAVIGWGILDDLGLKFLAFR
jgi:hypothetical protein